MKAALIGNVTQSEAQPGSANFFLTTMQFFRGKLLPAGRDRSLQGRLQLGKSRARGVGELQGFMRHRNITNDMWRLNPGERAVSGTKLWRAHFRVTERSKPVEV